VVTAEPRHRQKPAEGEAAAEPRAEREDGRRGRRGRGRGRERAAGERPTGELPEAPRAAPRADLGLSLARAFNLLREALSQLEAPVAHEALRLRMAALHGRDDELLGEERFPRLLRQAHDAEIADVNQVGEGAYEVSLHPTEDPRARSGIPSQPVLALEPPTVREDGTTEPGVAVPVAAPAGFGVRFRRGPRPGRPADVPLVGVVHLDDDVAHVAVAEPEAPVSEPIAPEEPAAKSKRPRGRATKKAAAEPAEAAAPKPKARSRAKSTKAAKKSE
jgi:hypothetical protein